MKISIIDNNDTRRSNIKKTFNSIHELELEINDEKNVYGNNVIEEWDIDKVIDSGDIVFMHVNNNFAELYRTEKCKDKWVVAYSGEEIQSVNFDNPKHFPFPRPVPDSGSALWQIKDFLLAIEKKDLNPFDKLIGFNAILETKLELLHKLLVPPNEKEFHDTFLNEWNNFIKVLNKESNEQENNEKYSKAWQLYLNGRPWQYHEDPFHENYAGEKKLLASLRDVLLP